MHTIGSKTAERLKEHTWSCKFKFAPCFNSNLTASIRSCCDATISGVFPRYKARGHSHQITWVMKPTRQMCKECLPCPVSSRRHHVSRVVRSRSSVHVVTPISEPSFRATRLRQGLGHQFHAITIRIQVKSSTKMLSSSVKKVSNNLFCCNSLATTPLAMIPCPLSPPVRGTATVNPRLPHDHIQTPDATRCILPKNFIIHVNQTSLPIQTESQIHAGGFTYVVQQIHLCSMSK